MKFYPNNNGNQCFVFEDLLYNLARLQLGKNYSLLLSDQVILLGLHYSGAVIKPVPFGVELLVFQVRKIIFHMRLELL